MQLRVLSAPSQLSASDEAAWRWLAAGRSPTEGPDWMRAVLETLDRRPPHLVVADGPDGPAAIASLVAGRALELPGACRLGEPGDLLAATPEALEELVGALRRTRRPLVLQRVDARSPTLAAVERAWPAGLVRRTPAGCTPRITLDHSWIEPEAHLTSRRRADLRRAQRRAAQRGPVDTTIHAPGPAEVDALLDTAIAIEAASWKGDAGTALRADADLQAFIRAYARAAAATGTLRIALLHVGEQPAAMQVAVEHARRWWTLKIGYDRTFARCSPGTLLLAETIAWAARRELEAYELLGEGEAWTEVWATDVRRCDHVEAIVPGAGAAAFLAHRAAGAAGRRWTTTARPALERPVRRAALGVARRAAASYAAGDTVADLEVTARRLSGRGYTVSGAFWDQGGDPEVIVRECVAAAEALGRVGGGRELALKVPPLHFALQRVAPVVAAATACGLRVTLDAHAPEAADPTLALAAALPEAVPGADIGVALPGRWARSVADAQQAAERGLRVRLVKGQWPAPPGEERDPRRGFLDLADTLAGGPVEVVVASHDPDLVRAALDRLRAAGTAASVELLYGAPLGPVTTVARAAGVPVQVYVPYGAAWLPYALRDVARHPRTAWWLVRDALRRDAA